MLFFGLKVVFVMDFFFYSAFTELSESNRLGEHIVVNFVDLVTDSDCVLA